MSLGKGDFFEALSLSGRKSLCLENESEGLRSKQPALGFFLQAFDASRLHLLGSLCPTLIQGYGLLANWFFSYVDVAQSTLMEFVTSFSNYWLS